MDTMRVELSVVPDCPHEAPAASLLRTALDDIGLARVEFAVEVVATQVDADVRGFIGSPTFCVDGQDLFPQPEHTASIACRLYPGPQGLPGLHDLRQALKKASAVIR